MDRSNSSKKSITPMNKKSEDKRSGTYLYSKNFKSMVKQFFENGVKSACKCGSFYIRTFSSNNMMNTKCANCGNPLLTLNPANIRLSGEDNEQVKMWKRSGRCPYCGYHSFGGKLFLNRNTTRYLLQMQCNCCNGFWEWLGEYIR